MFGSSHCVKVRKELDQCVDLPKELLSIIMSYYSPTIVSFGNYRTIQADAPQKMISYKSILYLFYNSSLIKMTNQQKSDIIMLFTITSEYHVCIYDDNMYVLDNNGIHVLDLDGNETRCFYLSAHGLNKVNTPNIDTFYNFSAITMDFCRTESNFYILSDSFLTTYNEKGEFKKSIKIKNARRMIISDNYVYIQAGDELKVYHKDILITTFPLHSVSEWIVVGQHIIDPFKNCIYIYDLQGDFLFYQSVKAQKMCVIDNMLVVANKKSEIDTYECFF